MLTLIILKNRFRQVWHTMCTTYSTYLMRILNNLKIPRRKVKKKSILRDIQYAIGAQKFSFIKAAMRFFKSQIYRDVQERDNRQRRPKLRWRAPLWGSIFFCVCVFCQSSMVMATMTTLTALPSVCKTDPRGMRCWVSAFNHHPQITHCHSMPAPLSDHARKIPRAKTRTLACEHIVYSSVEYYGWWLFELFQKCLRARIKAKCIQSM